MYVDQSAPLSHSHILHHDKLKTEVVIYSLLMNELTCFLQIYMFILYHAVLFLI